MTSEHYSVRYFKRNLKSKLWILALAMVVNALAAPVFYLIFNQNIRIDEDMAYFFAERIRAYWNYQYTISTVIILATALVVALSSFRFLFHRNMVDLQHSMPVKRSTVFIANYVNGFIAGYIPFLINQLIVLGMVSGENRRRILRGINMGTFDEKGRFGWLILSLTISFIAVYNLFILAIMLCGNIVSTIVCAGTMGTVVAIGTDAIGRMFKTYERTFYKLKYSSREMLWASPLLNVNLVEIYKNMFTRVGYSEQNLPLMTIVAVLLGVLAFVCYVKRPSEIAGHGLENKYIAGILRCTMACSVGIYAWTILVTAIANADISYVALLDSVRNQGCGWLIFGSILLTLLSYGILDSLFKGDIRNFFAHKFSMICCMIVVVAFGLGMHLDIFQYSGKIPEKDQIVGIKLAVPELNIFRMAPTDLIKVDATQEQIYSLLEKCAENEKNKKTNESSIYGLEVLVKCNVELKGNRSYQRNLYLDGKDLEYLKPFVLSDAYVKANYEFKEEQIQNFSMMEMDTMNPTVDYSSDRNYIADMARAYNQDLAENREVVVWQQGIRIANIFLENYNQNVIYSLGADTMVTNQIESAYFSLTDRMDHCLDVMKKYGMEDKITIPKAEDIKAIRFDLGKTVLENCTEDTIRQAASEAFGRYDDSHETVLYSDSWSAFNFYGYEFYDVGDKQLDMTEKIAIWEKDPKKIEELLSRVHFAYGLFPVKKYVSMEVVLELKDGREVLGILDCGDFDFADEYIEKFAELGRQYETEGHGITE